MGVLATDNFNRADNTDLGAAWDPQPGFANPQADRVFNISANTAVPANVAKDSGENYNAVSWPNDQYSQAKATMSGTGAEAGVGVSVRCSTTALTCYRVVINKAATNNVSIAKFVAGVYTLLAQRTTTWVDGDIIYLEAQGSTLKVKQNGTQLGADIVDSAIASGRAGIGFSSTMTSASLDDWEGGDFAVAARAPSMALLGVGA